VETGATLPALLGANRIQRDARPRFSTFWPSYVNFCVGYYMPSSSIAPHEMKY